MALVRVLSRRRILCSEAGQSVLELIAAMTILLIVVTPLVTSFTSAMRSEAGLTRRETAYENARLALQRMRLDIHCAGGVTSVDQNTSGGFTLTLTESHEGQDGWCAGAIPAGTTTSGVQWCTIPYAASSTRFVLYRYLGLDSSDCGSGATSTFQVDYVTAPPGGWPTSTRTISTPSSWAGNLWPDPTTCSSGSLPGVAVDLNVALDPVTRPTERYELRDQITLRNANRSC
jgi:Tfp pilus assembly protein PilW